MNNKRFPILGTKGHSSVPWSVVEQCREYANINHYQTLERLAERGGLSWGELYMCLTKQRWKNIGMVVFNKQAAIAIEKMFSTFLQADRENLKSEHIEQMKSWYENSNT